MERVLAELKAGRLVRTGATLAPDAEKGELRVVSTPDGFTHVTWSRRGATAVADAETDVISERRSVRRSVLAATHCFSAFPFLRSLPRRGAAGADARRRVLRAAAVRGTDGAQRVLLLARRSVCRRLCEARRLQRRPRLCGGGVTGGGSGRLRHACAARGRSSDAAGAPRARARAGPRRGGRVAGAGPPVATADAAAAAAAAGERGRQ